MLEINGLLKHSEQDVFLQGCIPNTSFTVDVDVNFSAKTQSEIIKDVCDFLGIENNPENYLLNSCEETGRIDFQLLENDNGQKAIPAEVKRWKKGKCRLWCVTYSGIVEEVKRKPFKLERSQCI